MITYAAAGAHTAYANTLLDKIKMAILYPLISLLLGVAILMFLWGVFDMVRHADDSEARSNGKKHMLAGLVGIIVMLSALTLLRIAANTVGVCVPGPGVVCP